MNLNDFLEEDRAASPRERYYLEQEWILSLLRRREDPYLHHLLLVHSLGRQGWKIFRMHRQPQSLPWTLEGMSWVLRKPLLQATRGSGFSFSAVDHLLDQTHEGLLQRQLLTVLACDYRTEQQRDFSGRESLGRAQNISLEILLGRIRESFQLAGRDEELFQIWQEMEADVSAGRNIAEDISEWALLVARALRADFLADPLPRNLARYFCEAWPDRKKRSSEDSLSVQ